MTVNLGVSARRLRRRRERRPHGRGDSASCFSGGVQPLRQRRYREAGSRLDRLGRLPQGNGACTHVPGPDVGEIRYGVPAGILASMYQRTSAPRYGLARESVLLYGRGVYREGLTE